MSSHIPAIRIREPTSRRFGSDTWTEKEWTGALNRLEPLDERFRTATWDHFTAARAFERQPNTMAPGNTYSFSSSTMHMQDTQAGHHYRRNSGENIDDHLHNTMLEASGAFDDGIEDAHLNHHDNSAQESRKDSKRPSIRHKSVTSVPIAPRSYALDPRSGTFTFKTDKKLAEAFKSRAPRSQPTPPAIPQFDGPPSTPEPLISLAPDETEPAGDSEVQPPSPTPVPQVGLASPLTPIKVLIFAPDDDDPSPSPSPPSCSPPASEATQTVAQAEDGDLIEMTGLLQFW